MGYCKKCSSQMIYSSGAFRMPESENRRSGTLFSGDKEQARYYDAHVLRIERRLHDIRGCRCVFLIRYDHDDTKERVYLKRLCCRPNILGHY
ncbi:hypothetical protein LIER_28869 [Lithospermum erythrorhizon]|uniref:SAWADEE domain-containing protein n=1 Tax=Lithospermum erythrorhizon TaxID=34254 RepID=A0AAV3RIV7_LITER